MKCQSCTADVAMDNGSGPLCGMHAVERGYTYTLIDLPPVPPALYLKARNKTKAALLYWGALVCTPDEIRERVVYVQSEPIRRNQPTTVRVWLRSLT